MTNSDLPTMSPTLRALIDADNARPGPSDSVRTGVYAAIGASLGIAPIAAIVAASAAPATSLATSGATTAGQLVHGASVMGRLALLAKAPLASVSIGVALGAALTAYVVKHPRSTPASAPTAVMARTSPRIGTPTPPARADDEIHDESLAVAPTFAPVVAPHVNNNVDNVVPAHAKVASNGLPERRAAAPAERVVGQRAPAPTTTLGAEQALLDPARAALARGDGVATLALLDQHARRFSDGELTQEREAMAIHALVLAGQAERAHGRADAFLVRYPGSLFWPMIQSTLNATLRSH